MLIIVSILSDLRLAIELHFCFPFQRQERKNYGLVRKRETISDLHPGVVCLRPGDARVKPTSATTRDAVGALSPPASEHPDPAGAIKFYTSKFDCEAARFLGHDAVWAQQSWLLFSKVKSAPPWELTSAIWHFGWGAEDMKAAYQRQLEMSTKFFTPLTDISNILGGTGSGRFFYAYAESPDHGLIELNTSSNHQFGHLHLFSEDPVAAGEWYSKHFGIPRRGTSPALREPRFYRDFQIGPSASLMMDNVNIIIYPIQYSRKAYANQWQPGQIRMSPTRGRVVDHMAFSVDNLAETIERLTQEGVKITDPIKTTEGGKFKHAFIEGPDYIRIELIEGHGTRQNHLR